MRDRNGDDKERTTLLTLTRTYKSDEAFMTALLVAGGLLLVLFVLQLASGISEGLSFLPV